MTAAAVIPAPMTSCGKLSSLGTDYLFKHISKMEKDKKRKNTKEFKKDVGMDGPQEGIEYES